MIAGKEEIINIKFFYTLASKTEIIDTLGVTPEKMLLDIGTVPNVSDNLTKQSQSNTSLINLFKSVR